MIISYWYDYSHQELWEVRMFYHRDRNQCLAGGQRGRTGPLVGSPSSLTDPQIHTKKCKRRFSVVCFFPSCFWGELWGRCLVFWVGLEWKATWEEWDIGLGSAVSHQFSHTSTCGDLKNAWQRLILRRGAATNKKSFVEASKLMCTWLWMDGTGPRWYLGRARSSLATWRAHNSRQGSQDECGGRPWCSCQDSQDERGGRCSPSGLNVEAMTHGSSHPGNNSHSGTKTAQLIQHGNSRHKQNEKRRSRVAGPQLRRKASACYVFGFH